MSDITTLNIIDHCPDGVNANKLIEEFGCTPILPALQELQKLGKKLSPILRQLLVSHREFDRIIADYIAGKKFYLYTGRGPSSKDLHLGHLAPFLITKELQDLFQVKLVIQITDDEKYLKRDLSAEQIAEYTKSNIEQIEKIGFDKKLTYIFTNFSMTPSMYRNIIAIQNLITVNHCKATFGIEGTDSIGRLAFPATQIMPCLPSSFPEFFSPDEFSMPCLIPCGIDQDPYFRIAREISHKLAIVKPALIHTTFIPSLRGVNTKMSSSDSNFAIFITDTPAIIKRKMKQAFSGGQDTKELHEKLGGNPDVDVAMRFLDIFMGNTEELHKEYRSGRLLSGKLKAQATDILVNLVKPFQNHI